MRHADDLRQRPGDTPGQHVEGDQRTDRERALEHRQGADADHGDHHQLLDESGHRLGEGRDPLDMVARGDRLRRPFVPSAALARLQRQGLHGAHAVHALDQQRLPLAFRHVERVQPASERADQQPDDHRDEGGGGQHDQREPRAVQEQHRDEDQQGQRVQQRQEQPAGQEFPQPRGLLHVPHDDPGRHALEEGDRQAQQVTEGARRHPDVDAVGRVQQDIAAQERQHRVEGQRDHHAARQHIQRRMALVHKDLVDDELEEDRHREPEQRQEQDRKCDIGEQPALAHDLGQEPAQAEPAFGDSGRSSGLEQQHLAVPALAERRLRDRERLRPVRQRVEHGGDRRAAGLRDPRDDHPVAVVEKGRDRHGGAERGELTPGQAREPRLQPRLVRDARQQGRRGLRRIQRVVMRQALRRQVHAMVPGDDREARQRGARGLRRRRDDVDGALLRQAASWPWKTTSTQ
jgi:hypothetical protein